MKKRVTIKDVARQADVTHTTVSRVIHNDERISEKTRRRVQRAVQALGYQPNLVARGLVKKHTEVIALVTPELTLHTLPIVQSVSESCAGRDYATMLFQKDTWEHEQLSFQNVAQNWLVDGLLIYNLVYHEHVPANILELQSGTLPFRLHQ